MSKSSLLLALIAIGWVAITSNGNSKDIKTIKDDRLSVVIKGPSQGAKFVPNEKIEAEVELSMPKGHSRPAHVIVSLLAKDGKSTYWDRFCAPKGEMPGGKSKYEMESWRMPDRLGEYDLVVRATFVEQPDPNVARADIYRIESVKVAVSVGQTKAK